ncbi:MAG: ABC transporter permease, partial [Anaerolineae bacterium]
MKLWQAFLEALQSLTANKMRSGLTILGIVIGVAAVIAMVSIGRGAQNSITGSIQGIGTNLLFVFRGGDENVRNPKHITLEDAQAIADPFAAPSVVGVAPLLQGNGEVTYGRESTVTTLIGVTPEYAPVRNVQITEGEFISAEHMLGRSSVAILGPDTADNLFGRHEGVVGETIRIEGQPFRVIGVLAPEGGSAFGSQDDRVLVPLTTAQTRLIRRGGLNRVDVIIVQAISAEAVPQAVEEVSQILRTRHRTAIGADDFTVLTQQDFLDTAKVITNVLTIFLGGIAAISLLVGGIGIMNIML